MGIAPAVRRVCCVGMALIVSVAIGCIDDDSPTTGAESETAQLSGDEATPWVDEVLVRIEEDSISPPVASRILGYTGVVIHEATVDGMNDYGPLAERLHQLDAPPELDEDTSYDVATVMYSALGHLIPALFDGDASTEHLVDFAEDLLQQRVDEIDRAVWLESAQRGVDIAQTVGQRALSDGYHARTDANFDPPDVDGPWQPVGDQQPLEPHWDTLQPFAMEASDDCQPAPPVEFSTEPGSEFYEQAMTPFQETPQPDSDEAHIAEFWADDPGVSPTPPGHWMAIATQMIEDEQLNLEEAARLYAMLGVTLYDAFISCWDEKYRSYLVRPVTYINEHIDPDWQPHINTPPFPEYTSGHASVSGAAAAVLTEKLGDLSFTDRTHEHRGLGVRSFDNFEQAAEESGMSRIYGGIHYPMANEEGLKQGQCVAETVLEAAGGR